MPTRAAWRNAEPASSADAASKPSRNNILTRTIIAWSKSSAPANDPLAALGCGSLRFVEENCSQSYLMFPIELSSCKREKMPRATAQSASSSENYFFLCVLGVLAGLLALFNILKVRIESGVRDSTLVGKTRERLRFEFLELGQEKLATFYFATVFKSYEISLAGST